MGLDICKKYDNLAGSFRSKAMVDQSLFDDFDAPGEVSHGLPAEAYIGDDFMRLERDTLFSENWVFVGYAHQLERAGDVRPIEVAGLPLFLLRDQQDEIVSFHNVCRHRNLKLIDADGNCSDHFGYNTQWRNIKSQHYEFTKMVGNVVDGIRYDSGVQCSYPGRICGAWSMTCPMALT